MKALRLNEPGSFEGIDIEEAGSPRAGEALVAVHRVGICGTDYSGYLGKMPFFSYPRIPGHELGVEVLEVGDGVTNVRPGDRCSVEPYMNCGECRPCLKGHSNCCENLKVLGVMMDGGLRERFVLPAHKLHASAKLSLEQLALVETLAIGCNAVNRGNPSAEESVLIIGAGPIGLSVLEFVKVRGARSVVMDMNPDRLVFATETMGAQHSVLFKGDGSEEQALLDACGGHLPDVVIDATGSNRSMSNALNYVGFTGRLVFVGITTQEISFVHPLMHRREMTLLASRNALPADFKFIISKIEEGAINTDPWITHRVAFGEVATTFPELLKPESGVVKAVIEVA